MSVVSEVSPRRAAASAGDVSAARSLRSRLLTQAAERANDEYRVRNLLLHTVRQAGCDWRRAMRSLRLREQSARLTAAEVRNAQRALAILYRQGLAYRERMGIDSSRNLFVDVRVGELVFKEFDFEAFYGEHPPSRENAALYGAFDIDSQKRVWTGEACL